MKVANPGGLRHERSMNTHAISFAGADLVLRPSGALWWPSEGLLAVSDLHLCKSERMARRGGALLPPYETRETLDRLSAEVDAVRPATVLCLGDSFDDREAAAALTAADIDTLTRLQAGRRWLWLEGNHDPGPVALPGSHLEDARIGSLTFRHIAGDDPVGEVSGHYHPKVRVRGGSRRCFVADDRRLILPAFGCYTGGLDVFAPALRRLFPEGGHAFLTGRRVLPVPLPAAA